MTYIVKQKDKNGNTYAYEVESYWDPKKKQARQKRRYLGVWNEDTGQIKKKERRRSIKTTKSYGGAYLTSKMAEELCLPPLLVDSFGEHGKNILALAMCKVMKQSSLKNIHHHMEDSYIPELCNTSSDFNSQWLSRFLENIARNEISMQQFHNSFISESDEDTLAFDITSLSSHSKLIELLEYGYNRDGLDLPQINLGLVMSLERKIPIYYKIFPGSITDVVTLKNLIADIKASGVRSCKFILDRGFYSQSNINEMIKEGIEFVLPLPFNVKAGKFLISETNKQILNPINVKRYNNCVYHVVEKEIDLFDSPVYGYVIYDKKRESNDVRSFYNRLMDIETSLNGKRVYGNPTELIDRTAKGFKRHISFGVKDGILTVERKPKSISQTVNRFGKMILISSSRKSWDEVLGQYRQRDMIEKEYAILKRDLDIMPLRVHKTETLKGLLFIFYVSLVIRTHLLNRGRESGLLGKQSVEDILLELSKLRAVHIGGTWRNLETCGSFEKAENNPRKDGDQHSGRAKNIVTIGPGVKGINMMLILIGVYL